MRARSAPRVGGPITTPAAGPREAPPGGRALPRQQVRGKGLGRSRPLATVAGARVDPESAEPAEPGTPLDPEQDDAPARGGGCVLRHGTLAAGGEDRDRASIAGPDARVVEIPG